MKCWKYSTGQCPGWGLDIRNECQCLVDKRENYALWLRRRSAMELKFMLSTNFMSYPEWCKDQKRKMDAEKPDSDSLIMYCHDLLLIYYNLESMTFQGGMDLDLSLPQRASDFE